MKKQPNNQQPVARVIRDSRDAKRDYFIPKREAQRLYLEGKLSWDCTNNCYTKKD